MTSAPDPRRADAHALLTAHRALDSVEEGHRAAMVELVAQQARPFDRSCVSPGHFTASGFVISPRGDSVLLVHHATLGRWLQPGGHVEPEDASFLAAARREVCEETGIEEGALEHEGVLPFDVDVHAIPARGQTPAHLHFDVRFLFRARSGRLQPSCEVNGARWVAISLAAELGGDDSVGRALRKLAGDR